MPEALARLLRTLHEAGRLPRSRFSQRTMGELKSLFDAGTLRIGKSGGGLIVEVRNAGALEAWCLARYPSAGAEVSGPPRAQAVGTLRDAKLPERTDMEPILLRGLKPMACTRGGASFDLREATRLTGAVCLVLEPGRFWSTEGVVAVVENLECFMHAEDMQLGADVALFASGRLSSLALDWLASEELARCSFVHCGDYDPVGLDEFLRLKARIGERVRLHLPANLKELVAQYGKKNLLLGSAALLMRLRNAPDALVREVVAILDEANCGLEQEILLLK